MLALTLYPPSEAAQQALAECTIILNRVLCLTPPISLYRGRVAQNLYISSVAHIQEQSPMCWPHINHLEH